MARYLIDANLPRWFSLWSSRDYDFVHDINPNWTDTEIWNYASVHGLTIVTKDADFSHRVLLRGDGPHVIHIRVGNKQASRFGSAEPKKCHDPQRSHCGPAPA